MRTEQRRTILFFEKGEMKIGVFERKDGRNIVIRTPDGQEKTISEMQVFRILEASDIQRVLNMRDKIDLQTIWSVIIELSGDHEIREEELLDLYNPNHSVEEKIAFIMKLFSKENVYFKNAGEGVWIPRDKADVRGLLNKRIEEEKRAEMIKSFRDWMFQNDVFEKVKQLRNLSLKAFFSNERPVFDNQIPQHVRDVFLRLKDFFITGKDDGTVKDAFVGITELRKQDVFKFLVYFGVLHPYENFILEKFDINLEERKPKVDVAYDGTGREKFTELTYSIDVEGTEIRDDAISVPKISGNDYELCVHIADVSLIDREDIIEDVIKRGKTAYFPEGKRDMLPENVVRFLSLDAGQPKPAITFKVKFSVREKIEITDVMVSKSEITVLKNYSFSDDADELRDIKKVGLDIHESRVMKMGGVDLISDDFVILVDSSGRMLTQRWKVNDMRIVVAEISMLCSHAIGWFCQRNFIPVFYRMSDIDQATKETIRRFNVEAHTSGFPRQYVIWKNIRASRHMETTIEPSGARSLGYEIYAWGTSPLRRSWDFINIIQISRFLDGKRMFSREDLERMKEKIESRIGKVESAEEMRYRYILSIYVMNELSDRDIPAMIVEKNNETVYWVEEILSFLRAKGSQNADVLSWVKVRLQADPLNMKITLIPLD